VAPERNPHIPGMNGGVEAWRPVTDDCASLSDATWHVERKQRRCIIY
jgi:hypothetical protein